jgi:hypothetical protein
MADTPGRPTNPPVADTAENVADRPMTDGQLAQAERRIFGQIASSLDRIARRMDAR